MAGHLLFVILMSFVHEIQAQEINSTSADSEPSSITIQSQKPQMSVQHFNGEQVQFVCSLPGSVKYNTRCNLYFGEASRPVLTATVWKKSSTETKQRFCQFYVSIDDFLRHLHFVQQKEASCDYTLKREPRSLSPRSDQYNLTAILESESPKINKPPSIMTTDSSLNKPSASTSTTSVNSLSGFAALNLSPTTGVNTPIKTTQYKTSGDSTTDSYKTSATVTVTTVKSPTFTWCHTSTHATATSVGQARQPDNKVNSSSKILQSAEASIWKLAVAVTGLGVTMGVILLVLGLLTFKRRSETCPQSRTKATSPGDFLSMTKMNQGRMLPAGNDGGSSVITSVPDDNYLTREEKLNLQETKNEDSDIYHVYATISEETDAPDSQDTI
ncbi:uncharacterized protein LOC109202129 [Oreochromis niloticus]|uniref:uncharacterized protein LOC109202129 n=1 Tax=Oreochromis niloticus TaxID=8128 RepID=UPI000DF24873|nr:uncharacterized protein LOC109202129 [Oreochromis niloticus]